MLGRLPKKKLIFYEIQLQITKCRKLYFGLWKWERCIPIHIKLLIHDALKLFESSKLLKKSRFCSRDGAGGKSKVVYGEKIPTCIKRMLWKSLKVRKNFLDKNVKEKTLLPLLPMLFLTKIQNLTCASKKNSVSWRLHHG